MIRDDIDALVVRRAEAWRRLDPAALAADYADDAVVESPAAGILVGREAIERNFRAWLGAFPDAEYAQEDVVVEAGRVVIAFHVTGTHRGEFLGVPPTGKRFEIRGITLMTIEDGRIVRDRRVYDFTGFLLKIGILKAKPI